MHAEEAQWLGEILADSNIPQGAVVLNLGSSSEEFRCVEQPWIDLHVFRPLEGRGIKVIHADAKDEPGVDIVVDITAEDLAQRVPQSDFVLCTNLLEHVVDRDAVIEGLRTITAPGGRLVVTVPFTYRFHPDPIDTMYRPTPEQLAADVLRPEFVVERAESIDADCLYAVAPAGRAARLKWQLSRKYTALRTKQPPPNDRCLISAVVLRKRGAPQ